MSRNNISTILFLCLLWLIFAIGKNAEYIPSNHKITSPANTCQNSSGTSSVEYFFNLVFTEFYANPPVCVCVQMCVNQPTYCYPNGCLKKTDRRKKMENTLPIANQHDKTKPIRFLVPDVEGSKMKRTMNSEMDSPFNLDRGESPEKYTDKYHGYLNPPIFNDVRKDPFKEHYLSLIRSRVMAKKKTPKLSIRYHLREQVKNTRSDPIVIEKKSDSASRVKWPEDQFTTDRRQNIYSQQDKRKDAGIKSPIVRYSPSRFFKRDLGVPKKIEDIQTQTDDTLENSPQILENLIEYLIESSFKSKPLTNETNDFDLDNDTVTTEAVIVPNKKRYVTYKNDDLKTINETTDVFSLNLTNENKDENKYEDDHYDFYTNVFNKMIEKLTENIDSENNKSIDHLHTVVDDNVDDLTDSSWDDLLTTLSTDDETTVALTTKDKPTSEIRKLTEEPSTTSTTVTGIIATTDKSKSDDVSVFANTIADIAWTIDKEARGRIKSRQKLRKLYNRKADRVFF